MNVIQFFKENTLKHVKLQTAKKSMNKNEIQFFNTYTIRKTLQQ